MRSDAGRLAVALLLAAAASAASAADCVNPPSDGWGRDYAKYATWCKCCGGEPYSSPGVGCNKTSAWAKTACSGYSGPDAAKGGPSSFFQAGVALAMAAPAEQAGAWIAAGAGLELLFGALSGNGDAAGRRRAADAAREEERRRRAEEERRRLEEIHARLSRSLKARSSWTGEAPTVGTLALKTDTNAFGTRRGGGLVLKQDGEAAKHTSARVEGQAPPPPPSVEGRPVPLAPFQRLSVEFVERSDEAVAARAREDDSRRRKEEAERRRAEAERRVAELRRERERTPASAPPAPAPPGAPVDAGAPPAAPPEASPDRLREAEELLRVAIGEDERQSAALEQAAKDRADADERLEKARHDLRAHLDGKGERG